MRISKKEINNILKLLEVECKVNDLNKEKLKLIIKKYIPCIDSINDNTFSISAKTNLIYDIPKNYFSQIKKIGIDINKVKTSYVEFVIDYNLYKNKILIYCDLSHILENTESKLLISKRNIIKTA